MRVTINVLHREAIRLLKEKGYKIILDYIDTDDLRIFCKSSMNQSIMVILEKKESCYIYTISTNTSKKEISATKNYLANLRLFIEKEL